jgi:hypothetical protein
MKIRRREGSRQAGGGRGPEAVEEDGRAIALMEVMQEGVSGDWERWKSDVGKEALKDNDPLGPNGAQRSMGEGGARERTREGEDGCEHARREQTSIRLELELELDSAGPTVISTTPGHADGGEKGRWTMEDPGPFLVIW